jgi:hypothetical protein
MRAESWRAGYWTFTCPNECEYRVRCRKYIDYRTKRPNGIPMSQELDKPEYVM